MAEFLNPVVLTDVVVLVRPVRGNVSSDPHDTNKYATVPCVGILTKASATSNVRSLWADIRGLENSHRNADNV